MAVAALAWLCAYDPQIAFLPRSGRAEWILFPSAPDPASHPIAELDALFRREFILAGQTRKARLSVRAAKRVQLMINGNLVDLGSSHNWKDISDVDVAASLRAGTNTIEARVFNDNGPPALWLALRTDSFPLQSDASWETSFAGSAWRRAALATTRENRAAAIRWLEAKKTLPPWPSVWPMWMVLGGFAMVLWWGGTTVARSCPRAKRGGRFVPKGNGVPADGHRRAMVGVVLQQYQAAAVERRL